MTREIPFALNHIAAPRLDCRSFLDLAAALGCAGVELRNDLADKGLTRAAFFDGDTPGSVGDYATTKGVPLLGLSEVYGFNDWSDTIRDKVERLVAQATEAGASSISLIPRNDAPVYAPGERDAALSRALDAILPILERNDMIALIEPLGFTTSSLRRKADAVAAIEAVGGEGRYKLVHDTFHHFLAGETEFFPDHTGIVHISGVVDPDVTPEAMQDAHRILVDARDRLGNVAQIRTLLDLGYAGAFSFEPFSPAVHALDDPEAAFGESMAFIRTALSAAQEGRG